MKFKIGDKVIVTAGKDKGKKSVITKLFPERNAVLVEGANLYVKHVKPFNGQAGDRVKAERPLPTANVAILNDADQPDRVGYKIDESGKKTRVFKKSGKPVQEAKK